MEASKMELFSKVLIQAKECITHAIKSFVH